MRRGRFTVRFAMSLLLGTTALSPGMLAQPAVATPPSGLALARPESVGLSPEALGKIDDGMQSLVDKQHLAGVVDPTNDLVMVGIIQRQGGVPGAVNHEDIALEAVSAALPPLPGERRSSARRLHV